MAPTSRDRARASARGLTGEIGLHKDAIRRIALEKLEVVYRDWNFSEPPFADFATEAGERREDARAFLIALVAALLGGLSEAIAQNNAAISEHLRRRRRGQPRRRDVRGGTPTASTGGSRTRARRQARHQPGS